MQSLLQWIKALEWKTTLLSWSDGNWKGSGADGGGSELGLSEAAPLFRGAAGADFEIKGELWIPYRPLSLTCGNTIPRRRTQKNCFDRFEGMLASHPNYKDKKKKKRQFKHRMSGTCFRTHPGEQQDTAGRRNKRIPEKIIFPTRPFYSLAINSGFLDLQKTTTLLHF